MKKTVKDFILDNLTDKNFEKLVNTLIMEEVRDYHLHDNDFIETISNYLKNQKFSYANDDTFEILNEIQKVSVAYITDYRETLLADGLEPLNNFSMSWMPSENKKEKNPEKLVNSTEKEVKKIISKSRKFEPNLLFDDIEIEYSEEEDGPEIANNATRKEKAEYLSLQNIKIALIPEGQMSYEDKIYSIHDMDMENYKEFIHKNKIQTTQGLVNFIYEVLHYSNDSKLENKFEDFSHEKSFVKITDDHEFTDGYGVHFLLDSRSRYAPRELKEAYRARSEDNTDSEGRHNLAYSDWDLPINPPEFVEYFGIIENQQVDDGDSILAPFTFYLNEELVVPEVSNDILYEILGQLIHVLTIQGFTKENQIHCIKSINKSYVSTMV